MARKGPADRDGAEAVRRLLSGLARGDDLFDLAAAIQELHPRHDTFPGEVFMRLAADALEVAGVRLDDPVPYAGLCEKYLGECKFQGRDNRKIQFAILASASALAGSRRICLMRWPGGRPTTSGCCGRRDPRVRRQDGPAGAGLRSAVVSPVDDHHGGGPCGARRALTGCRRCRRLAVVPSRDWQQARACGAGR